MPLFDDGRLMFLHIPKTGGTSIEQMFKDNEMFNFLEDDLFSPWGEVGRRSLQHLTFGEACTMFPDRMNRVSGMFAVVRHPVRRLMSEYLYQKQKLFVGRGGLPALGIRDVEMYKSEFLCSFDMFVHRSYSVFVNNPSMLDNHFLPQAAFLQGLEGHPLSSRTKIYRFEDSIKGECTIMSDIARDFFGGQDPWKEDYDLPHKYRTSKRKEAIHPHPSTMSLIRTWYQIDFDFFGYK